MSRKSSFVAGWVALCAILAASGILASNMAFKVNYPLYRAGSNGSKSGTQDMGLPYFPQAGLTDAFSLIRDIEGSGPPFSKVVSVSKFLISTDALQLYTGRMGSPGPNFPLVPGECYRVQVSADVNYILWGSHDPSLSVPLRAPGPSSNSGTNTYTPPYNIIPRNAFELMKDVEGIAGPPFSKVVYTAKYLITSDNLQVYTGRMGSEVFNEFNLVPGECYRIQVSAPVGYVASHY